jgi:hypothetical protein
MVKDAVFGYLDEIVANGQRPDDVSIAAIATYLGLDDVPKYIISECRRLYKDLQRNRQPQPTPNPNPQYQPQPQYQAAQPIPDWMLAPYKMQIDNYKEERDRLQKRVDELERELREEMKRPSQTDPKWQELDKLAFERLKKDIEQGRNSNSPPKSWMEELVSGLVNSGQLTNIATEAASLLSDLRNRGNPDHDPYAEFYAQKMQREAALRRQPRRVVSPPANIKRRQQPQTRPQPQPQPQPQYQYQQPMEEADFVEVPRESNTETEQIPPQTEGELSPENQSIFEQFVSKYPDLADTVPTILVAIDAENPGTSKQDKIRIVIETLRVVAQLREIGVGVKGIMKGTFTPEQAATFMIQRYPEQARLLAEQGPGVWLERGNMFANHPVHGKDIMFLQEPEARATIDKIVAEIRKRFRLG